MEDRWIIGTSEALVFFGIIMPKDGSLNRELNTTFTDNMEAVNAAQTDFLDTIKSNSIP